MANQPKLERISIELSRRIKDPVNNGNADGDRISSIDRMMYINKALLKIVDDVWMSVKGDKKAFCNLFPELVVPRDITTLTSPATGTYKIVTPNLDFFQLMEATINNGSSVVSADVRPSYYYQNVLNGRIPQLKGNANSPIVVEIQGTITFAPVASFSGKAAHLTIIRLPINGYDGSFLQMVQSGTLEDSPFNDARNSTIAARAEQFYREEANLVI